MAPQPVLTHENVNFLLPFAKLYTHQGTSLYQRKKYVKIELGGSQAREVINMREKRNKRMCIDAVHPL